MHKHSGKNLHKVLTNVKHIYLFYNHSEQKFTYGSFTKASASLLKSQDCQSQWWSEWGKGEPMAITCTISSLQNVRAKVREKLTGSKINFNNTKDV